MALPREKCPGREKRKRTVNTNALRISTRNKDPLSSDS